MKKNLGIVAVVLAALVALVYVNQDGIRFAVLQMAIKPKTDFVNTQPPPAPDYTLADHWAALPGREDLADVLPQGNYVDVQTTAEVDVFFVHPTTYLTSDSWNQPLDNQKVNDFTDTTVMQGQASVFNGCCRIYAPRYRQATIFSFMDQGDSGHRALDLAYEDVKKAFRNFIETKNEGRPFILAGHSQGSKHADLLLKNEIVGTPIESRLVAAYPIGFDIDGSNGLPVCDSATQTGCQVSWNAVGMNPETIISQENSICVNPLSWMADGQAISNDANLGAVNFSSGGHPEPGAADAICDGPRLNVANIISGNFSARPMGFDNLHIFDYALFYINIRENAQQRVQAWLSQNKVGDI
ncbi:MAG: DUF3089 domain-containing protein [bacterium]|nr:DUF3089 domain-containing protein [Gammaproteobacteria bacterium]